MSQDGVYLYGFALPERVSGFAHPGLDEIGEVRILEVDGLAAIVSSVCPADIESGLTAEPPEPNWIVPRALHHDRVLEAVMARSPVLPTRFGCVFSTRRALEAVAGRHREEIGQFLRDVADREEWTLKVLLDENQAVDALLRSDPGLSERFVRLPEAPGTRYFLEKKLREEARRKALREGKAAAGRLHGAIQQGGALIRPLASRAGETGDRPLVLKLAILVPRGGVIDIVAAAERAAAASIPLILETTGPLAPYHFCPSLGEPPP